MSIHAWQVSCIFHKLKILPYTPNFYTYIAIHRIQQGSRTSVLLYMLNKNLSRNSLWKRKHLVFFFLPSLNLKKNTSNLHDDVIKKMKKCIALLMCNIFKSCLSKVPTCFLITTRASNIILMLFHCFCNGPKQVKKFS